MLAQTTSLRSPSVPSALTRNFGTMKSEIPFVPSGASGSRASTRWMMFSAMSCSPNVMKIFVPVMQMMVAVGHGTRAHLRQIGAGLRLGETHRPGPLAGDQIGNEALLLLLRADQLDRFDRALIEQRSVGKTDVRGVPHLERRTEQYLRQPLPAVLRRNRQTDPAGLGKLLVRFLEARGRRDLAVVPRTAFLVADSIERVEHPGGKRRGLFEHRVEHVERLFAAGQRGYSLDAGKLAQSELHVAQGGPIGAHLGSFFRFIKNSRYGRRISYALSFTIRGIRNSVKAPPACGRTQQLWIFYG